MDKIRVLLANHPVMVPDAIRALVAQQDDMEVVGDCRGPMKILQETGRAKADAVILAQEGMEEPGLCSQLLAVYPDLTILSMVPEGDGAFMHQLCSRRSKISGSKGEDVMESLRAAVQDPRRKCSE